MPEDPPDDATSAPDGDPRPGAHGAGSGVSSLAWSLTRADASAVRAGVPYTAPFVTRVGRFAKVDPRKPGRLWSRWRWLGLLFWAGLTGGAFAKAWKDAGGLPDVGGDVVSPSAGDAGAPPPR